MYLYNYMYINYIMYTFCLNYWKRFLVFRF